jgi:nucleoside transporter
MNLSPRAKFSLMMFLEFFIWGAWLPLAFDYLTELKFSAIEKSWIMSAFALASITAMFFSTQFADRNFAAERFLAFSHLVGGLCILALGWTTTFWPFFILMLVHSMFYVPTISITNSIAFANLPNPKEEFGQVRLWGTIGWIAASLPFVFILVNWSAVPSLSEAGFKDWLGAALANSKKGDAYVQGVSFTYVVAGIASLVLSAFCLTLPHTPPKPAQTGEDSLAWLKAMKLLKQPFLLVLFIVTFIDATVHAGFFLLTGSFLKNRVGIPAQWIMPVMTIGQIAEIATMAALAYVLKRLGWRATMTVGVLGHAVRFGVFAFFPEAAPAILVNVLHGICYAFFFATVYIFIDEYFPKDIRASAQGLFNFLILGVGPFVGNFVWPELQSMFTTTNPGANPLTDNTVTFSTTVDYGTLFLFPSGTALVGAILLMLFFHPPAKPEDAEQQKEWPDVSGWQKGKTGPDVGLPSEGPKEHGVHMQQQEIREAQDKDAPPIP